MYFLTAPRIVSRLLGALINQCIWRQSCPHLGQILRVKKIQTYLMKVGYIAWRKDRLELQNFHILIGQGISQWLRLLHIPHNLAAALVRILCLMFLMLLLCLMFLINFFFFWLLHCLSDFCVHSSSSSFLLVFFGDGGGEGAYLFINDKKLMDQCGRG